MKYKRICIIGNCGSGKSTLAQQIALANNMPLIHIDKLYWRPNWVRVPKEDVRSSVENICAGETWVFDGNNKSTFNLRFNRADCVIFLDYNPFFCCFRAIKRALTTTSRPDMADGCQERINLPFYKYILGFRKNINPYIENLLNQYTGRFDLFRVHSPSELKKLYVLFNIDNAAKNNLP